MARSVNHPFDSFRAVPDYLLMVVCNILSRSPLETMKRRALADELADENQAIFYNMNTGCASVLKGKHLALLEKDGFKLTGLQHPSGILLLM